MLLAEDTACDPRNPHPGAVFNNKNKLMNIYGDNIEVDYRGYEVTVDNFIRILTGRHDPDVPKSKRLMSDSGSNVLIYLTGHGGDQFIKFQDIEDINSKDLADAIQQMYIKKRYNEILIIADTCQAATLFDHIYSPHVISVGSSLKGENSYSHHSDSELGITVIDRFTYYTLELLEKIKIDSTRSLKYWLKSLNPSDLASHYESKEHKVQRDLDSVLLTDFFGSVTPVMLTEYEYPI